MKRLVLFTLLLATVFSASAQNLRKKYTSTTGEQGSVYFIYPQDGFTCGELGSNKELVYDITYVTFKDSVTYNFTYRNKQANPVDSVQLRLPSGRTETIVHERLFVEPVKSHWAHRISLYIPKPCFRELYASEQPYEVLLYTPAGVFNYTIRQNKWNEQRNIVNGVLQVIDYN